MGAQRVVADMTFPVPEPTALVTDDYQGHKSGRKYHRAWDIGAPIYAHIVAPEAGRLVLWYMVRAGNPLPTPDESARQVLEGEPAESFSWYFADRYGACVIVLAPDRWWLFAHVPPPTVFAQATVRNASMLGAQKWRDSSDATRFVELYSNTASGFDHLPLVDEGEVIALIGDSGYSTAPHTHMECIKPLYEDGPSGRIDPASLFAGGPFAT